MKGNDLSFVLAQIGKLDHWDVLEDMSTKLMKLSERVSNIHHKISMEDVMASREEITPLAVDIYIMLQITKSKLCVSGEEWNTALQSKIDALAEEYTPSFEEMEF